MKAKSGITIVEVMVAIVIFTIVMLSGFLSFFYGRTHISHSNHERMALELAKEKIERLKAGAYTSIVPVENENISLGGIQFTRNTVASAGTGVGIYGQITVTTSWQEQGNSVSVHLATIIAR